MTERCRAIALSLALSLAAAPALIAQQPAPPPVVNVDDLVAKNLQARGGADKIAAIQTMKQTAKLNSQGMDVTMTLYSKRPNLSRKELTVGQQTVLYGFDGSTAWTRNPLSGSN